MVTIGGGVAEFCKNELPTTKSQIEREIMNLAIGTARTSTGSPLSGIEGIVQNPENDFDFDIATREGTEKLDLLEIAPLSKRCGSYDQASETHWTGERAEWVTDHIAEKSRKYGLPRNQPTHLLLYATHGPFRLTDPEMFVIAFDCREGDHGFESIEYLDIRGDLSAVLYPLFPVSPSRFDNIDIEDLRKGWGWMADFSRGKFDPQRQSVSRPLRIDKRRR